MACCMALQALALQPGEVVMVGTAPFLYRFSFTGEMKSATRLSSGVQSAFCLAVLRDALCSGRDTLLGSRKETNNGSRSIAAGAIACGGVGGCVDVISRYSTRLACISPLNHEE
ncbi:hypothetical protein HaLaN_13274 [Haematococcus lacustris]|uniref:Uncharacterized protein n=1 Tax=Haematococcus lacustris TaxID=44745 RepID=A0A699Z2J6_HAELA|nr:hypothetical protein HaLaN_13274 [Haematococcus lacustris]